MVRVANRFSGTLRPGDPRSNVTGGFGCTWPTMPAHRFRIQSDDATGMWSAWNNGGALVERSTPIQDHDDATWLLAEVGTPFELVEWRKLPKPDELQGYIWRLTWKLLADPLTLIDELEVPRGECNVSVPLPNWFAGPSFPGSFGTTARADQVEFDKTEPPD